MTAGREPSRWPFWGHARPAKLVSPSDDLRRLWCHLIQITAAPFIKDIAGTKPQGKVAAAIAVTHRARAAANAQGKADFSTTASPGGVCHAANPDQFYLSLKGVQHDKRFACVAGWHCLATVPCERPYGALCPIRYRNIIDQPHPSQPSRRKEPRTRLCFVEQREVFAAAQFQILHFVKSCCRDPRGCVACDRVH